MEPRGRIYNGQSKQALHAQSRRTDFRLPIDEKGNDGLSSLDGVCTIVIRSLSELGRLGTLQRELPAFGKYFRAYAA